MLGVSGLSGGIFMYIGIAIMLCIDMLKYTLLPCVRLKRLCIG
jgi:hypothetical protein